MPYNGSGAFSAPGASFPAVSGALIESAKYNAVVNDIATGLSTAIAKDGQTTVTANLPMAGYRHTGAGNAVSRTDYAAAGQVQDSSTTWAGTAGGTADAITLTMTPAIAAYAAGQSFTYKSGASANTTTMTVNVNGVGAKAIQKNGVAMAAGDHAANSWFRITYDGAAFQLTQIFQPSAFMLTVMDDADAATARTTLGAVGLTGNETIAGNKTFSGVTAVGGTATNDDASAGYVGEYLLSELSSGSALSLVNNTPKTVISRVLTAGDWDVDGLGGLIFPASTSYTDFEFSLSTTTNTLSSWSTVHRGAAYAPGAGNIVQTPIKSKRVTVANGATTTIYLVINAVFTVSTLAGFGAITARRRR